MKVMCAAKPKNSKQLLESGTVYGSRAKESKNSKRKQREKITWNQLCRGILLGPKIRRNFLFLCSLSSISNGAHFRSSFLYSRHSTFDDIEQAKAYFGRLFSPYSVSYTWKPSLAQVLSTVRYSLFIQKLRGAKCYVIRRKEICKAI